MANKKKAAKGSASPVKNVVRTGRFTIEIHFKDDQTMDVFRTCEGFTSLELLGVLYNAQRQIIQQMERELPPPQIVKRTYIKD